MKTAMQATPQDVKFVKQVAKACGRMITTEQARKAWPIIVAQTETTGAGNEAQDIYDSAKRYFFC